MNLTCPKCGKKNNKGSQFCRECGATLGATSCKDRTKVIPSSSGRTSQGLDAKAIAKRAQTTFGPGLILPDGMSGQGGGKHQRELTVFLIDVSNSMNGRYGNGLRKIDAAKQSNITMIIEKEKIDPKDEIGLIAFNHRAHVLLPISPIHSHKRQMIESIQSLKRKGGTNIKRGLKAADEMFDWNRNGVVRRIILLTDGRSMNPYKIAKQLKDRGVVIDTIGIGRTTFWIREGLLKEIASVVQGQIRYRFIKDHPSLMAHYTQLAAKTATGA